MASYIPLQAVRTLRPMMLILIVVTLLSCANEQTTRPGQSIILFKDKDGLYLYDLATRKEKIIFEASDSQIFLDEPYRLTGDTLVVGISGQLVFVETSPTESGGERYFRDYFTIDLKTGKNWLSEKVSYEVIGHSTLNIKRVRFDSDGKSRVLTDTSMEYKGSRVSYKGVKYNDFTPRFFAKQSIGDQSVFSSGGSIYYTDKSETTLLVEYKGHFDPKFGSGYFQPQLDPTGKYAVFRYLPGFANSTEETSLQRVDIQTGKSEVLKTGEFREPAFSADGKSILFKRDERKGKSDTWISKIYLLDLTTLREIELGDAYSAQWVPLNAF